MSSLSDFFAKRHQKEDKNTQNKPSILQSIFKQTSNRVEDQIQIKVAKKRKQIQEQEQQQSINKNDGKRESQKKPQQIQNLQSTIFVGNIPITIKHKQLKKHFNKYGSIEKIWFRSIPVQRTKMGPKATHILKKYIEDSDTMNAYVKFTNVEDAKNACQENGSLINDNFTIRVTMCMEKQQDFKSTIFIGNLPFNIKQDELRNHFKVIGKIQNVRVIKNNITHLGIGIGYVKFSSEEHMKKAINELNGSLLGQRNIRVKKAVEKKRLDKKIEKVKERKYGKVRISNSKNSDNEVEFEQKGKQQSTINKLSKKIHKSPKISRDQKFNSKRIQ